MTIAVLYDEAFECFRLANQIRNTAVLPITPTRSSE